ncbi:MAG: hypothetical protein LH609_16310, partial [Rudanella sp.]|nr:hypothetical protein [Rudanella sp.]
QPDLRAQLAQFASLNRAIIQLNGTTTAEKDTIDALSTDVFEALSDLRFDDEGLEMDEDDYDSEESPDPDPLIESVLSDYADRVTKALREGRLADALTVYLGVYEGSQAAAEAEYDEYGVIDDYPTQTWEVWHGLLADAYTQLANRVLHPDQIGLALGQLAERVRHFDEAENNPEELYYDLKAFEPLLLALVTDMPSAGAVQRAIAEHNWQKRSTEYVQLRLADVLHDPDLWLKTADQFADLDPVIALQLLQRRQKSGDLPVLLQTLHRLSKRFPNTFDAFILDHLNETMLKPGVDLNLYLAALETRCRAAGHLDDYLKLREFWTEKKRRQFADRLQPTTANGSVLHPLFFAQVLHTEGRTSDLLDWLKKWDWLLLRQMPDILKLTAQTHPNECLNLAMKHSTNQLENGQRGRAMYQAIAGWLAALNTVKTLKPQVIIFAAHLSATYSRLSALREELRGKGLMG